MKIKRIYILGGCGSGKTYLTKKLSKKLRIKNYDLDNIAFTENNYERETPEERDKKLKKLLTKNKTWIIEGVYAGEWIKPVAKKADLIIILNTKPLISQKRILLRYIKRKLNIDKTKEGKFKDIITLLKYAHLYPKDYFLKHKNLAKKYEKELIILKNNKQINDFLGKIK